MSQVWTKMRRKSGIENITDSLIRAHNIQALDVVDNNIDYVGFLANLIQSCSSLNALA